MADEMAVLHVVAGLHPDAGGPSQSLVGLTDALSREHGVRITLMTQSVAGAALVQSANPAVVRVVVDKGSGITAELGLSLRRSLVERVRVNKPALLHGHGLWAAVNHWTAHCARNAGIPLVIHPRGMLESWALAYRGWKKRLALSLYQRRDLESAALLFATAEKEAESFRRLGLEQPIAVIRNGVELPVVHEMQGENEIRHPRRIYFLGRIHPIKGLLNLLDAWAFVRSENWQLVLAGPDEGGHLAEVMQRARVLGLERSIAYFGRVAGEQKERLFWEADVFVLPSFSENFGVAVAEALAHGRPVITTQGTPWAGLETYRCGWWVEPTVEGLSKALREAVNLDSTELHHMGARGRKFSSYFNWANVARQTAEVYRWVLGRGDRPDCVWLG
jgi:glycosyltransferase involved in cell wall biosynthesis